MKTTAAVLEKLGEPLRIQELDVPPLLPGQVLVKMAFSGVCHSQLMEIQGQRGVDRYLPHLLGHEGTGVVVAVGAEVAKVRSGDRIILTWIKGVGANCAGAVYGSQGGPVNSGAVTTFSTFTVVSENRCVRLPDSVPMDVGCLFGCALPTGAGIVLNMVKPVASSSLVVWGLGGVGLSALLGARMLGCAPIIAVDIQEAKLSLARELGAHATLNAREADPLVAIRRLTGGEGADYAVEAAGRASTIEQAFQCVKKGGGLCVFASHPPTGERIQLDPYDLICGRRLQGSWGGECHPDEDIPKFARFHREGRLPLEKLITHRVPLRQIDDAFQLLSSGKAARVLIEIDPTI